MTVSQVSVYWNAAPAAGTLVGITTPFTSSTIPNLPWLGKATVPAGETTGWHTYVLDTPVSLTSGTEYTLTGTEVNYALGGTASYNAQAVYGPITLGAFQAYSNTGNAINQELNFRTAFRLGTLTPITFDASKWDLIAARGADGATGPQGPAGAGGSGGGSGGMRWAGFWSPFESYTTGDVITVSYFGLPNMFIATADSAPQLFVWSDDFAGGLETGWAPIAGSWGASGGVATPTSFNADGVAIMLHDSETTDWTFTATVTSLTNAGIVFAYKDEQNYAWVNAGTGVVTAVVNGVPSTIWNFATHGATPQIGTTIRLVLDTADNAPGDWQLFYGSHGTDFLVPVALRSSTGVGIISKAGGSIGPVEHTPMPSNSDALFDTTNWENIYYQNAAASGLSFDENNHAILAMTDGTTYDAGPLPQAGGVANALHSEGAWTGQVYTEGAVVTRDGGVFVATAATQSDDDPRALLKANVEYVYGHSIANGYGASDHTHAWSALVATHYGDVEQNRAIGGRTARGIFEDIGTDSTQSVRFTPPVPTDHSFVVAQVAANTERLYGNVGLNSFRHDVRAIVSIARGGTRHDSPTWSYDSPWTDHVYAKSVSNNAPSATQAGQWAEVTFTGTAATFHGIFAALSSDPTVSYSIDGVTVRTVTYAASDLYQSGDSDVFPHITERFTNLSAGSHTLRVTLGSTQTSGAANDYFYIDTLIAEPDTAPLVILVADNYSRDYSTNANTAPYNNSSNAVVDAYNAVLDAVATEFDGKVVVVRPTGWDPVVHMAADDVHPNDAGHQLIADSIITAVDAAFAGTASAWQLLVEPAAVNAIYARYSGVSTSGTYTTAYRYQQFTAPTYVVEQGDVLEYEVYWFNQTSHVGFDIVFADSTDIRDSGVTDQNGLSTHPTTDISSRAYQQWYARQVPLSRWTGVGMSWLLIGCDHGGPDPSGKVAGAIRNVRITSGGVDKVVIWPGSIQTMPTAVSTSGTLPLEAEYVRSNS
jgi:lysophospholipase L1-like esterase